MELYEEILLHLRNTNHSQLYEEFQNQMAKRIESECFMKIEQIVRVLESVGSNGGSRHDFS